jgi:cytoskeletal protein RodZ
VESLGEKLRLARENKGFSVEQVGRETNIARRYIESLEQEDFDKFPGEPYLLGFLRNYGEHLGLDVEELLSLYRAIKIQEQPIPVEQLLRSSRSFPKALVIVLAVLAVLAAVGGGVYVFLSRPSGGGTGAASVHVPQEYTFEGVSLERRLYRGDTVLVPLGGERFKIELRDMGDPLTLIVPRGTAELRLGGDTELDLNGDGFPDMKVTLADYDRASPSSGASLQFTMNFEAARPDGSPSGAVQASTVIFSSSTPYPFTLQVRFQGYCMFRWETDNRERNERYFARNEELNLQAQNGMRIWVSNAAALKLQVIGAGQTVPLEIGSPGEVVVSDLRWRIDENGRFQLVQSRLE